MSKQARSVYAAITLGVGSALIAVSFPASSQAQLTPPHVVVIKRGVDNCSPLGHEVMAPQADGPITAAPYSGIGTTEVVTTLSDGNRIVRKNTMRYFRDSQGRTRTEFELAALGPIALNSRKTIVNIYDPVANERYILHPELKRADVLKLSAAGKATAGANVGAAEVKGSVVIGTTDPAGGGVFLSKTVCDRDTHVPKTPEPLGEKMIEGVRTVGSRLELTIPAGSLGNELPMTMSSEQWFSPELGAVILSTQHDPMTGDTTYRLSQIARSEPDASLFTVPAGYSKQDVSGSKQRFEIEPTPLSTSPQAK